MLLLMHFIRWRATYPLDKAIRCLKNWGLYYEKNFDLSEPLIISLQPLSCQHCTVRVTRYYRIMTEKIEKFVSEFGRSTPRHNICGNYISLSLENYKSLNKPEFINGLDSGLPETTHDVEVKT